MAEQKSKKVVIDDIDNEIDSGTGQGVEVKKSERLQNLAQRKNRVDGEIENFYYNKDFDQLQKPKIVGAGITALAVLVSIIFGLISGTAATIYILNNNLIDIGSQSKFDQSQSQQIQQSKNKPVEAVGVGLQQSISKDNDSFLLSLDSKVLTIFKAKTISDDGSALPFLQQIYAPWQIVASSVAITNDGWLLTGAALNTDDSYVVIDNENNVVLVEQIITDLITGVNFLRPNYLDVGRPNLETVAIASYDELSQGREVVILDRFKNYYSANISNISARNIYKTEDLVRSTDRFSDFLRLGPEVAIASVPYGIVFGLDNKVVGVITKDKIVPAWYFKNRLQEILQNSKFDRPYLGIDYLRIEEAPGLMSDLFKDLANGSIVYGLPAAGSPAAKAGIENADIIIKFNDIELNSANNLTYLVQQKNPGDTIVLTVLRKGEQMVFNIILETLED